MANVSFLLWHAKDNKNKSRKRAQEPKFSIYLVVSFGSQARDGRLKYSTGLKIEEKWWNKKTMRVRDRLEIIGKDAINFRLNELENAVVNFMISEKSHGKKVTMQSLRVFLDTFTGKEKDNDNSTLHKFIEHFLDKAPSRVNARTGKTINAKDISGYHRTYELLRQYEKERLHGIELDFDDINIEFNEDFQDWLRNTEFEYTTGNSKKADKKIIKKKLSVNTIAKKVQTLKLFLNEATKANVNTNLQYKNFNVTLEVPDTIYLNEEELKTLKNAKLNNETTAKVRDLFVLQSWCGLRYSDLITLTKDKIKNNNICLEQKKTTDKVTIPLFPEFIEIWQRYGEKLPIAPTNQFYNATIKEACKMAGLTDKVEINKTIGGKRISEKKLKYDLVTTHTARRSFITNLSKRGVPHELLMKISGHKTLTAFERYLRAGTEEVANLIRENYSETNKK